MFLNLSRTFLWYIYVTYGRFKSIWRIRDKGEKNTKIAGKKDWRERVSEGRSDHCQMKDIDVANEIV